MWKRSLRSRYGAGVAASLIAEAVFMIMVAAVAAFRGNDPWTVVRVPASFLLGLTRFSRLDSSPVTFWSDFSCTSG